MRPDPGRITSAFRGAALSLLALQILASCVSPPSAPQPLRVDGLEFENRSRTDVQGIRLLVPASNNFVSCGRIPPGGVCASRFPAVSYLGDPVVINWRQGDNDWSTGELRLGIDEAVRAAGAAEVRVVVLAPGSAAALLVASSEP